MHGQARKVHQIEAPWGLSAEREWLSSVLTHWRPSHAVTTAVVPQTLTRLTLGGTNLCLFNNLHPGHSQ